MLSEEHRHPLAQLPEHGREGRFNFAAGLLVSRRLTMRATNLSPGSDFDARGLPAVLAAQGDVLTVADKTAARVSAARTLGLQKLLRRDHHKVDRTRSLLERAVRALHVKLPVERQLLRVARRLVIPG
jgi:hypothetical protein